MAYAVLQYGADRPTADQLVTAFESLDELTHLDARRLARHPTGILAERLTHEQAQRLQVALADQGLATAIADEAELLSLPPRFRLRRADCGPEAFTIYDGLNQPIALSWDHVIAMAAARVTQVTTERSVKRDVRYNSDGRAYVDEQVTSKDVRTNAPLADILLDADPWRLRVESRHFRYDSAPDHARSAMRWEQRFCHFVMDVARLAPYVLHNLPNAGAFTPDQTPRFRSPQLFEKELRWLAWYGAQSP